MEMKELVQNLEIGNSVAEFDQHLEKYFVETGPFQALISDNVDIISGDKGTGKTAIYKILQKRYPQISELSKVEIITGFNPAGNPVFQSLAQQGLLTEGQYITIWKAYILSLVGNWLLELYDGAFTDSMYQLDDLLKKTQLRSRDDTAASVFGRISSTVARFLNPISASVEFTFSELGIPIITPKVELGDTTPAKADIKITPHEEALGLLEKALSESDIIAWIVLDRLDEAFQGFPKTEVPALRALFRSYLDLLEFPHLRLKLFVRNDLFRKITQQGFVNLTHVNARKVDIIWDEEDLLNLLCQRIKENPIVVKKLQLENKNNKEIFNAIFPDQVIPGTKRPTTWNWIMERVRDGNNIKPPRNLIDLIIKSRAAQLRKEDRDKRVFSKNLAVIEGDSLQRGLSHLSSERVGDTLLAETGDLSQIIELFRDGKAEHNVRTLSQLLNVEDQELSALIKSLIEIGFIEQVRDAYKIPMLYRDGLNITQGKAL